MHKDVVARDFVNLATPDIGEDEIQEVMDTLRSGWVIAGPRVSAFERLIADQVEAPHVRCLNSCSAGLLLALRCVGVERGGEVLLPTLTFAACANVVEQLGAVPVFVDSEPGTGLIDLDHAATLVGDRTSALVAVHLGGRPLDMERLNGFRDRHGVAVVEDAAHAIGAAWGERPVGAYGNPTSFSFHATKNMTSIEGGALALESEAMAERVRRLASQGLSASAWDRHAARHPADYDLIEPGYKAAMTDVAAAVGIHQLRKLDAAIETREQIRLRYDAALAHLPVELEPEVGPGVRHARHLYRVLLRDDAACGRDALLGRLREHGVGCSVHFRALHTMTHYARGRPADDPELPGASDQARRTVSLPISPGLTEVDQERVVTALEGALA